MPRFASTREAKEFLIAQILGEAVREGVSLDDLERKMLYFSVDGWMPPNAAEAANEFDNYYETEVYERKIGAVVLQARRRARQNRKSRPRGRTRSRSWTKKITTCRV